MVSKAWAFGCPDIHGDCTPINAEEGSSGSGWMPDGPAHCRFQLLYASICWQSELLAHAAGPGRLNAEALFQ